MPLELQALQVEEHFNSSAVFFTSWISVSFSYFPTPEWIEICIWHQQKFFKDSQNKLIKVLMAAHVTPLFSPQE